MTDDKAYFLFVQTATAGSFTANPGAGTPTVDGTPVPGGGAEYVLTLEGHGGGTVYFSDRPDRIFGEAPTQAFLDGLGFAPGNPPNAALVTQTDDGTEEVIVLELLNPTYDEAAGTVTYGATILDEYAGDGLAHVAAQQQDMTLPESFGRTSLFIDDCSDIPGCEIYEGRGGQAVGPIPNGINSGQCWSWSDIACEPCNGWSQQQFADACNAAYSACNGRCFVELG